MAKSKQLNEAFHIILEQMIATGKAPDHTQLSAELGVPPKEGQKLLRKLFSILGFPGWLEPKTDNIVSFAPFNNVPTNYGITIEGEQKWFGQ